MEVVHLGVTPVTPRRSSFTTSLEAAAAVQLLMALVDDVSHLVEAEEAVR